MGTVAFKMARHIFSMICLVTMFTYCPSSATGEGFNQGENQGGRNPNKLVDENLQEDKHKNMVERDLNLDEKGTRTRRQVNPGSGSDARHSFRSHSFPRLDPHFNQENHDMEEIDPILGSNVIEPKINPKANAVRAAEECVETGSECHYDFPKKCCSGVCSEDEDRDMI